MEGSGKAFNGFEEVEEEVEEDTEGDSVSGGEEATEHANDFSSSGSENSSSEAFPGKRPKDTHTHKPRGFGFVTFADPSVIDTVMEDEHVIDGRMVEVKRTLPRGDMPPKADLKTRKIFVGGITPSLTEDELKEHFASYGEVVDHQIMLDHSTGHSRGFGFVTFESEQAVEKVVSEGRMFYLAGKQVEVKKAEPEISNGDQGINWRSNRGTDDPRSTYQNGAYGYGGDYRSGGSYYGGMAGYGYGRGYESGGSPSFAAGFGQDFGSSMYGGGAYGGYAGCYLYGLPGGYGAAYGGGQRYGSRYHPYEK